mmetsp:Transcript_16331/g.24535  ORF Transcript_16331/g.24535 Transcript_16331/m.24535 type:complete len:124 (-) Transcript_16331:874-1245(-)
MLPTIMSSFILLDIVVFVTAGSIVGFANGGYESIEFSKLKSAFGVFVGAEVGGFFVSVPKTGGLNVNGSVIGTLDGDLLGRFEGVVDGEVKGVDVFEDTVKGAFEVGISCEFRNSGPCVEYST